MAIEKIFGHIFGHHLPVYPEGIEIRFTELSCNLVAHVEQLPEIYIIIWACLVMAKRIHIVITGPVPHFCWCGKSIPINVNYRHIG